MADWDRKGQTIGEKLSPKNAELYRRCDEALHYIWDPIGVAGAPGARDEYEGYVPEVFRFVRAGAADGEIVDYLLWAEAERMGLPPRRAAAEKVAGVLQDWARWLSVDS